MPGYRNRNMNGEIRGREREGNNGKNKDNPACKGGQEIYHMPVVRAKGTVFAPGRSYVFQALYE
jgi:hypothetical protein